MGTLLSSSQGDIIIEFQQLPKAVYDSCTKAQLENRFGQVTAYQHLNGTPHAAKPQLRTQSRKIQGPEVSGPWLIAEKSAWFTPRRP